MEIIIIKFTIHKVQKEKSNFHFEVCRKNTTTRLQVTVDK